MKNLNLYLRILALSTLFLGQACSEKNKPESQASTADSTQSPTEEYYSLEDFKTVKKIDTHVHIRTLDTSFLQQAREDNFRLLDISVDGSSSPTVAQQQAIALKHVQAFPERTSLATSFTVRNWNDPSWQQKTLTHLKDAFNKGAIGVKVWKNIGMELRDKNGKFVMIISLLRPVS